MSTNIPPRSLALGEDDLTGLIHHIFLPPKLPQSEDEKSETLLPRFTLQSLGALAHSQFFPPAVIENAIAALQSLCSINGKGHTDKVELQQRLRSLPEGRMLAVKICAQNAAVLVTRLPEHLRFECFELSPSNSSVMATIGRLVRSFPAKSVDIQADKLNDADFTEMISSTLSKMCSQEVKDFLPKSRKGSVDYSEYRDTADPSVVSGAFFAMLSSIGSESQAVAVTKRTREEVLWKDALRPWRRSPMWLLIRVTLQLVIERSKHGTRNLYKHLMVAIMADVLVQAQAFDLPMDTLYIMEAKISRRLLKLGDDSNDPSSASVHTILDQAHGRLSMKWSLVQRQDAVRSALDMSNLRDLDTTADTFVARPRLEQYLDKLSRREPIDAAEEFTPTSNLTTFPSSQLPALRCDATFSIAEKHAILRSFEAWVMDNIEAWTSGNLGLETPGKLHQLMKDYHAIAKAFYNGNPEATSIMLLTLFSIWICCDRGSVHCLPLLTEYSPGLPTDVLENLLLTDICRMQQLRHIEEYLKTRDDKQPAYQLFTTKDSAGFAARFFDTSDEHQELLERITHGAQAARERKVQEFEAKMAKYLELSTLADNASHEYRTVVTERWSNYPKSRQVHCNDCQKCKHETARDAIRIAIFEWPIPRAITKAKSIIFELMVPTTFAHWRDSRAFLQQDVLRGKLESRSPRASYILSGNDPHLFRHHRSPGFAQRYTLLSETKPAVKTHYNDTSMSGLVITDVCVPNGLDYHYYDTTEHIFAGPISYTADMVRACTYQLATSVLQDFIFRPRGRANGPQPNEVIAQQDACPQHKSLEEHKDLTSLSLGHRIQWCNIASQLISPSINFKDPETVLFILQCMYQAGPSNEQLHRSAHDVMRITDIASSVIASVRLRVRSLSANWESIWAFSLFACICTRVLSLNETIRADCLALLAEIRNITADWVTLLSAKADACTDEDRKTFIVKTVQAALVCVATMHVESDDCLRDILKHADNVCVSVRMTIVICEGARVLSAQESLGRLLRRRITHLMHRSFDLIIHSNEGLNNAIKYIWPAYEPGQDDWTQVHGTYGRWITTRTASSQSRPSQAIHLDLLEGQLLVDGLPLDQAPEKYQKQPLFSTLFGQAIVKIMPSSSPGFTFSTQKKFAGYSVQIGLAASGEMIVQASNEQETLETIPEGVLEHVVPRHFQQDYVYWFNSSTGIIDLRPKNDPWNSEARDKCSLSRSDLWQLRQNGKILVGFGTRSSRVIANIFAPLADQDDIHVLLDLQEKHLRISLTLLPLSFKVSHRSSRIYSRDHASMYIDTDQSIGTLTGLASKLVLRNDDDERLLLVPQSDVRLERQCQCTIIEIDRGSHVKLHAYTVDTVLGRLVDTGDLGSKLYLAYLHALSSSCLPDPLTCDTGTESSLTILSSQVVLSYEQISASDIRILRDIASISPSRQFYPQHRQEMQNIQWNPNLSVLAQHNRLQVQALKIIASYRESQIFHPADAIVYTAPHHHDDLLCAREDLRSSSFRIASFGAEDHTDSYDRDYQSRVHKHTERAANCATISQLYCSDAIKRHYGAPGKDDLWNHYIKNKQMGYGATHTLTHAQVSYDAKLLDKHFGLNFLISHLLPLRRHLRNAKVQHRFTNLMFLACLAYAQDTDLKSLQVITMSLMSEVEPPSVDIFKPVLGRTVNRPIIIDTVERHTKLLLSCPEVNTARKSHETDDDYVTRRYHLWERNSKSAVKSLAKALVNQWPCSEIVEPTHPESLKQYIDVAAVLTELQPCFRQWYDNLEVSHYFDEVERQTRLLDQKTIVPLSLNLHPSSLPNSTLLYLTHRSFFTTPSGNKLPTSPELHVPMTSPKIAERKTSRLDGLIKNMASRPGLSGFEQRYIQDLRVSCAALMANQDDLIVTTEIAQDALQTHLESCEKHFKHCYEMLKSWVVQPQYAKAALLIQLSPRLSVKLFLRQINRHNWDSLPDIWKERIIAFGLSITSLQRAQRLVKLHRRGEPLTTELRNEGHISWDPLEAPENLLIEMEHGRGLLIRPIQAIIAKNMQRPSSGTNSTIQLNMGEGKSTILVPIIAIDAAKRGQIARVITGKPQGKQMAQMLRAKLGGLIDRRVFFMPFSRFLQLDSSAVRTVRSMTDNCQVNGGIILSQPEHILSFQMMAPENHINGTNEVGCALSDVQDKFDHCTRDIVDESDEQSNVRFELIYSMGAQNLIDGGARRWILAQGILSLTQRFSPLVATRMPDGIEIRHAVHGSFPRTRILQDEAGSKLVRKIAKHICYDDGEILSISRQTIQTKRALYIYLTKLELSDDEVANVEQSSFWTETTMQDIFLLRGLLAGGILTFVFAARKRWRVKYGTTSSRTPPTKLAVPYAAKDFPTPRSEFSHPDVVILLTTLCYYYAGLCDEDMFSTFQHLLMSDEPDAEYAIWVKEAYALPAGFVELQGVNLLDKVQCVTALFPALHRSKSVVDYFLSKLVFPKEMKEFPSKLTASGWDIAKEKDCLTTGFSGTNDSRHLLPDMIRHLDLPQTRHTNALVLEYLLGPENETHMMPNAVGITDAEQLLATVMKLEPPVQVILDVGAVVIEMTSLAISQAWLNAHDASKEAVVFVDEHDELCVVDRKGHVSSLQTSPLVNRLSECLVYLDEAHTRGIDLKLPGQYRAAVTLGAQLTKDRLVQACMRMRRLGQGQSVVFCIQEEVQNKIRCVVPKNEIDVASVLEWAMSETCDEHRRNRPSWAVQGERFYEDECLWTRARQNGKTMLDTDMAKEFLDDEAQTIQQRYRPRKGLSSTMDRLSQSSHPKIRQLAISCQDLEHLDFSATTLQEEQERELAPEQERESQVQLPPAAKALPHSLDPLVKAFAVSGILPLGDKKFKEAFTPAFDALRQTSGGRGFDVSQLDRSCPLWVTQDFVKTVNIPVTSSVDSYQRTVQWVLTSYGDTDLVRHVVIISPFEANDLYQIVLRSKGTAMHPYRPRCNVNNPPFDSLTFCSITGRSTPPVVPRRLTVLLGLFSGQLYITSYDHYKDLCEMLGLSIDLSVGADADGFIRDRTSGLCGGSSGLKASPVPFLSFLMSTIRRNGEAISKTHMGRILQGRILSQEDFVTKHAGAIEWSMQ